MKKWFHKKKNERGAVTIEATIALTSFLFMFIMIYSIVTICRAQAIIQVAINSTAKELSQYSYIYSITGLHGAMGNLAQSSEGTRGDVNEVAGNIADVFTGIQSIGGDLEETKDKITDEQGQIITDISTVETIMDSWSDVEDQLNGVSGSVEAAREKITAMAQDPQKLLFGMAKLFATEGAEYVKSVAAEAVSRVLTQKHLRRSENDTAEAFCQSVGIVPGTYCFKESYFNGIDFSHSTLFPYGSDEITIVANYKMKLLQLLPISFEFHFTQKAVTKGWMQGDGEGSSGTPSQKLEAINNPKNKESLWNSATPTEREKIIRSMGITELKSDGYSAVSGQTYIHAYDKGSNTFAMIRSYNPLASVDSVDQVDRAKIRQYLESLQSQMLSATDNLYKIKIKKQDSYGNVTTQEVDCSGNSTKKIIVVIPQDTGLDVIVNQILGEMGPKVSFEILPGYGTVYGANDKTDETGGG